MGVITRAEWGATYGAGDPSPAAARLVVLHHSYRPALSAAATPETEREAVRGIERHHVQANGWSGIGYNWLIAPSGRAYEGRGWGRTGAHAKGVNSTSVGICLLMDGSAQDPTPRAISEVRGLIAVGIARKHIERAYRLTGHRDHAGTDCPGDRVYARLAEFRHDHWQEIPDPSGELAVPATAPAASEPPNLERIILPTREVYEAAAARFGFDPRRMTTIQWMKVARFVFDVMATTGVRQMRPAAAALERAIELAELPAR